MEQTTEAIDALFDTVQDKGGDRDGASAVIIYVHGRALAQVMSSDDREPRKSERQIIPELLSRGGKRLLLFHWPHFGKLTDVPEEDARRAGPALAGLLQAINTRLGTDTSFRTPVVLVTHSLGSVVLEEALRVAPDCDLSRFRTVAIFAPTNHAENSASWLARIHSQDTYVIVNKKDPIPRLMSGIQLGECDAPCLNTINRSDNAIYVDISPLGLGHRYLAFGHVVTERERTLADRVVSPILRGESVVLQDMQANAAQHILVLEAP